MVLACALLAAASLPLGSGLSYDAWGWLLWGRELVGSLPFTTASYPSWKPLTALIAVPLAPLGDAAPWVWLFMVRASALVAVLLAFRLARRAAGPWAGALAAAALLLMPDWVFQAGVGESEPLLTALLLAALDRHIERRDGSGLALAFFAALLRPEAWILLALSGVVTWRRRPALRPWVGFAVVALPVLWLGGDYLGSGSPFTGGHLARISKQAVELGHAGGYPPLVVVRRAAELIPALLLLGVPVAFAAGVRRQDPLLPALCCGAVLWTVEVAAMSLLGYAGLARLLFPAAAAAAIAGAAGLVILVRLPRAAAARSALAAVALVGLAVPAAGSVSGTEREATMVEHRTDIDQSLGTLMARVGRRAFDRTGHVSAQGVEATALAWRLGVDTRSFGHARIPEVALELRGGPWPRFSRQMARDHLVVHPLASDEELSLLAVTRHQ
jgi:hypothetical protein